MMDNATNHTI